MILHKTNKTFMSRSDKPNENWLNSNDYYVIEDESELYYKILESDGNFEYILDENNNLVNIEYQTKITQDEINIDLDYRISMLELGI